MLILYIAHADYNINQEAVATMFVESVWIFFFFKLELATMGLCKSFRHNLV